MHDTSVRCTAREGTRRKTLWGTTRSRKTETKASASENSLGNFIHMPSTHKTAQNCHVSVETGKGHSHLSLSLSIYLCLSLSKHAKVRKFLALNNECNMQNTLRRRGCKSNEICKFCAYTQSQRNDRQ